LIGGKLRMSNPSQSKYRRLLLIELNEFDPSYLQQMAGVMKLTHVRRLLELKHARTTTSDLVEHQGLDPWVQWVGVHSGKSSQQHRINRLGATQVQTFPQVWNAIADRGYSWGVWGVMNAPRGPESGGQFFMPDPWSFEERAHPKQLNDLLALPRYAATNYLHMDYRAACVALLRFARFFAPPAHWHLLARFTAKALRGAILAGVNVHTFATLLDYLSVLYFVRLRSAGKPDLSIIFLNLIAHLQHQFWKHGDRPHPEMKLGLQVLDAMLGMLFLSRCKNESIVVMNGLKQENVAGQGFHVYRQINPQAVIEALGIRRGKVEQCMTHDAHILFKDATDADLAEHQLRRCMLSDGHSAFYVEREGPTRVFYQLAFQHDVGTETRLVCDSHSRPFFEAFRLICIRTGAHIPDGDVFFDGIPLPSEMANHEIFDHVLAYFPDKRLMSAELLLPHKYTGIPVS
jgi:hypothetical protein